MDNWKDPLYVIERLYAALDADSEEAFDAALADWPDTDPYIEEIIQRECEEEEEMRWRCCDL